MYPQMNALVKNYINQYDDPLKIFLEISLNQIDFFKNLPKSVKNEWIFSMKAQKFEAGALLY